MRRLPTALLLAVLACSAAFAIPEQYQSQVRPRVEAYAIPEDLAGVRHVEKASDLTDARKRALSRLGFVVIPDRVEQMFFLYEDYGEDIEKGPIPNFITVDSVLQAYHIFFDFSLRTVEQQHLVGLATKLTHLCAGISAQYVAKAPEGALREAAARNLAYFLVARRLLTGQEPGIGADLPGKSGIIEMARAELERIAPHAGRFPSAIMERTVHYDQFSPRGHYTRSEELKKYFLALMWYGTLGFELDEPKDKPQLLQRHCLQALLIAKMIAENEWGQSLWERIYEPTSFFVGGADDLTWRQYLPIARRVYGDELALVDLADMKRLEEFIAAARKTLPPPGIAPAFLQTDEAGTFENVLHPPPQGRQFRFMGQRFIPDSYALQQLVYPLVGKRPGGDPRYWPMGLDVMAALGSDRAREILHKEYEQGLYAKYGEQLAKVTGEFQGKPEAEWWQNLYWGWLHSLRPLLAEIGEGYPTFMRTPAWLDKELMTAQGSWAQLRHDTILYGKPSGAEMGGGPEKEVQGYVEPYPDVYGRLAYLAHISRSGLQKRGLLPEKLDEPYDKFTNMLLFLKECAEKQLVNTKLSKDDYERIQWFGGEIERLSLEVVEGGERLQNWYEITNEADRHMATIADIHTSSTECLEVGVGYANRLYVIVPDPAGGLQLAKGGVMSYYEFKWPVSDRLTDEKWIEMLKAGKQPPMPAWTRSFVAP